MEREKTHTLKLLEALKMAQRALLNLCDPSKEYNHTYNIITEIIKKAEEKSWENNYLL